MDTQLLPIGDTTLDLPDLRARLDGEVFAPADEGWDLARQAWNLAVDQQPAAVALPESADDVIQVVELARRHGLQVAPPATTRAPSEARSRTRPC